MTLTSKHCTPCEGGVPPLTPEEADRLCTETPEWTRTGDRIHRVFRFDGFRAAMAFVQQVADLAEEEGHHPDIHIHYDTVRLELWTHAIGGLSENDFILAAKVDRLV